MVISSTNTFLLYSNYLLKTPKGKLRSANTLVKKKTMKSNLEVRDMPNVMIDIDKLLETTLNLTSEKGSNKIKTIEIDQLLEKTRDW